MDTMRSTRAKQECESAMVNGTVDQVGRPARVKDDGDQDELGAQAVHQTAFGGGETSVAPLQRLAGLAEGRPEQHRTGQAGDHQRQVSDGVVGQQTTPGLVDAASKQNAFDPSFLGERNRERPPVSKQPTDGTRGRKRKVQPTKARADVVPQTTRW